MKNRIISVLLSVIMLLSLGASASADGYQPGTYTGTENGRNGAVTVEVTVSANRIEEVRVVDQIETIGVADAALEQVPQQIVETQSLTIDAVTGATLTRYAILSATRNALLEAGASEDTLKIGTSKREAETRQILETDVLVIGGGAAGLSSAVSTAEGGREVLLLEKEATIGGNAVVSGGWLDYPDAPDELRPENTDGYDAIIEQILAADYSENEYLSSWQQTLAEEYAAYQESGNTRVFDSMENFAIEYTLQGLGAESAMIKAGNDHKATAEWFIEHGADFTEPLQGIVGFNWPRWTRVAGTEHGEGLIHLLEETITNSGLPVTIMTEVTAISLILNEEGAVVGANAVGADGTEYEISANAVVMATGGFSADNAKLQELNTDWPDLSNIRTTNRSGHTFDSMQMALDAGALSTMLNYYMIFPEGDPVTGTIRADITATAGGRLYVNKEGVRFVDETLPRNTLSAAIMSQTDGVAYVICNYDQLAWVDESKTRVGNGRYLSDMLASGEMFEAETVEELAKKIGLDPATLNNTVTTYNGFVETYHDTEFGRTMFFGDSLLAEGPYYAYCVKPTMHITLGGLIVDENYNVLNTMGQPIGNLYAGGEVLPGGSIGNAFSDGLNIGHILTEK
jgi:fumarate reductase flavoprotein subunit